jgi:DNA polymerase-3 subunit delta'
VLAEAAGPALGAGLATADDHPTARLFAAGSHPDFRYLERLERSTGGLARNISVDQVRSLGDMLGVTPSLSPWRAIVVDAADDLEASAANALLKMLEEPPANTLFFLIAHAPGRLLPTIRSRCRRLEFNALSDDVMASLLAQSLPEKSEGERRSIIALAGGSVGRALDIADLDLAPLEQAALTIMREGDADNARRSALSAQLSTKAAADRYLAFLELVPNLLAREAPAMEPARRSRALSAYARARETAVLAPRLTLDPGMTVFHLGSLLADVALKR